MNGQNQDPPRATGGCLCRAVRYRVRGPLREVVNCHCEQCRRTSGHFVAATAVARDGLELTAQEGLAWYHASDIARRGFCQVCGSSLFWEPKQADYTAIMAGTLDRPTGLTSARHIFVADKGDYYGLADGLEQFAAGHGADLAPPSGGSP